MVALNMDANHSQGFLNLPQNEKVPLRRLFWHSAKQNEIRSLSASDLRPFCQGKDACSQRALRIPHCIDHQLYVFRIGVRRNAVTQIEDMRTLGKRLNNRACVVD